MKHGIKSAFVRKHPNLNAAAIVALAAKEGIKGLVAGDVFNTRRYDAQHGKSKRNGHDKPIPLVPTAKALAASAPAPAPTNGTNGHAYPTEFEDIRTLRRMVQQQGFDRVLAIARTIQVCATEVVG